MYVCMYVCMFVCMYVCMFVFLYSCLQVCMYLVYVNVCMSPFMSTYVCPCVHICKFVCVYVCICAFMYIRKYTFVYVGRRTYIRMCLHVSMCVFMSLCCQVCVEIYLQIHHMKICVWWRGIWIKRDKTRWQLGFSFNQARRVKVHECLVGQKHSVTWAWLVHCAVQRGWCAARSHVEKRAVKSNCGVQECIDVARSLDE